MYKNKFIYPLIILIFAFLLYSNTLNNSFVWDDHYFIEQRQEIRQLSHIFSAFTQDQLGVYRPVREIFYTLAYKAFNHNPVPYHILGILIHALNSILVFLILLRMLNREIPSFLLALLFAAHPIHVEAVAFATSNFDLIGIAFFLASFYFFIENRVKSSLILFALAAFTYEVTLSLPFILLAYVYLFPAMTMAKNENRASQTRNRIHNEIQHALRKALPYFIIAFLYISIRFVLISLISRTQLSFSEHVARIIAFPKIVLIYLGNLIWPRLTTQHLMDYSFDYKILLAWIVILLSFLLVKNTKARFGVAFLLITLLPVSNIIPIQRGFAEMYAYLAVFGFLLSLYSLLAVPAKQRTALLMLLVIVYSSIAFQRNNVWQDDLALWQATVNDSPHSSKAHTNLALELAKKGRLREAIAHGQMAVQTSPDRGNLYFNLATIYDQAGLFNQSIAAYVKAIDLNPRDTDAYINIAILLAKSKDFEKAEQILNRSLAIEDTAVARFNRAMIYKETNRTQEAIEDLKAALERNPGLNVAESALESLERQ